MAQSQNPDQPSAPKQKTSTPKKDPFENCSFLPLALTPEQAALMLNMSLTTLKTWRQKAVGPPFARIHGRLRYMTSDLERWLADQAVHPEFDRAELMSPTRASRRAQLQRMMIHAESMRHKRKSAA